MLILSRTAGAAIAIGLALSSAPLASQVAKAPPADRASVERAAFNFKLLTSAMQSDKIPGPVKDRLFGCIYNNSLGKISEAMDKVIAENKGKIVRTNPDQMIAVMAGVCGFRPQAPAPAAAPKR
jgi:hypothetical protein